ncbi:MAG: phosphoribosylaminoimidazolesuccinocarboxamide synthase [bacterium]|nr:phosphoribosylaminoimidazolesuccinocarboxamide synthase [bacterium]
MKNNTLQTVNLKNFGKKYQGKVRDYYIQNEKRIIITTDRISAFDVVLGFIPHKGQVLNQLSAFWFDKTKNIVPNHILSIPDPNVMVVKNCKLIPIEMVVRGYISGVTGTSIWGSYEKGERIIYGIKFPNNLSKNQKLKKPVITPTTKAETGHDQRLTEKEILQGKIVSPKIWREMKKATLQLFERGTKICAKSGIILVDTKYEFGLDKNNKLMLIDEIHTPDSSRFWIKKTYKQRFEKGLEPENFDKEFLRLWYAKRGYKGDGKPPKMTNDLIKKVSNRYVSIYEKITGKKFVISKKLVEQRIKQNLLLQK